MMFRAKLFVCSALLLIYTGAYGLTENGSYSTWRVDMRYSESTLIFMDDDNDAGDLHLTPENYAHAGIHYSTNGLTIGLSSDAIFGNDSVVRNFFISWFGLRYGAEIFYQRDTNYYISNSEDNEKKDPGTPNEYPNLEVITSGLSLYYFFRDNNYRGLNSQGDELRQNAWSPFVKFTGGWFSFQNDQPIIPAGDRVFFDEEVRNIQRGVFYQLNLSVGLMGTLSYGRYYCSGIVSLGGSLIQQRYRDADGSRHESYGGDIDTDYQMFLGYSGDSYFFGLWFMNENYWGSVEDLKIQMMHVQVSLYAGIRL